LLYNSLKIKQVIILPLSKKQDKWIYDRFLGYRFDNLKEFLRIKNNSAVI